MRHKTINKLISALLVFALIGSFTICAFAADASAAISEISEFKLLEDLGVYDGEIGADGLEAEVSRGDAAEYIAAFLGLSTAQYKYIDMPYSDVNSDDECYGAICALYSAGIISAGSEFRADDPITSIEALKMILTALGFEKLASLNGGYPSGYVTIAVRLRLSSYARNERITLKDLFGLMKAATEVDVMEFSGTYIETNVGVGILEKYRGILKMTGVVSANRDTDIERIDGVSAVHDDEIKINGKVLKDSDGKAYGLIGIEADVYYDEKTEEVISAVPARSVKTLRIFAQDIERLEDEYTIAYYDDDRDERVQLNLDSNDVKVLKNERYLPLFGKTDLDIEEGYIELYDTDSDGLYELVRIVSPEVYIVDKASDSRVYLKYGKLYESKNYIEKNDKTTFRIDGKTVEPSEFVEWDIINVYTTGAGGNVRVESEYNRVSGTLNSVRKDSVTIDGREYKINPNGNFTASNFEIGASIDAYLDLSGRIYAAAKAAVSGSDEDLRLGYICKVSVKEDQFGGGTARFKIYRSDMEFEWFLAASRLKIYSRSDKNGKSMDLKKESALRELKNYLASCGDGTSECQIVKYKVDSDNKITTIYCAIPDESLNDVDEGYPLVLSYDKDSSSASSDRHAYTGTLNFAYAINWGFDYWNVPENKDDEEMYSVVTAQNMGISGSGYTFDEIKLFNVNSDGTPEFALRVSRQITGTSLDDNSPTGVISEIGKEVVNDEIMSCIKVYSLGSVKTLYMDDSFINRFNGEEHFYNGIRVSDLNAGDVIAFKTNEKNHIVALRVLVRNSDRGEYRIKVMKTSDTILVGSILSKPTEVIHMVYGEIAETEGGAAVKIKTDAASITPYLFRDNGQVLKRYTIINNVGRNPSVRIGTASDICVGDKVAFRWTWRGIDDVFVYKD